MKQVIQFRSGRRGDRDSSRGEQAASRQRGWRLFIFLLVAGFWLCPMAQAVNPPVTPDPGRKPVSNTADGQNALISITTGIHNTAIGFDSLLSNTDAKFNTAVGSATLLLNNGAENTAVGAGALLSNTTGGNNTANGAFALFSNSAGFNNTAIGDRALLFSTGDNNTATGAGALTSNTSGNANTAMGVGALVGNQDGGGNTAMGVLALGANLHGASNTAVGLATLQHNDNSNNTAIGASALNQVTIGMDNTAVGLSALHNNATGDSNTAIGKDAGSNTSGSGNVCIGASVLGASGEANITRIRNIGATPIISSTNIVIAGIGGIGDQELGYAASSQRYKQDIKPMDKASETLFALKPVSFRAKHGVQPSRVKLYGLIAEDVATVDPDLVIYNAKGQPETLRFDSINAMLLNEFLKEHKKVEQLKCDFAATVAQQHKEIQVLTTQLKEQAAQIQRVSARVEVSEPALQMLVVNKP